VDAQVSNQVDSDSQAQTQRWYSADGMLLAINASTSDTEVAAMRDAVLLDENASLLSCVALCNGADVDWVPTTEPDGSMLTHTLHMVESPEQSIGLVIPEAKQAKFLQLPQSVADLAVLSPTVHQVLLRLDQVVISDEEALALQPGSLLLLPASFSHYWQAALQTTAGECRVFVQAEVGLVHFNSWDPLPGAVDQSKARCDVFLQADVVINMLEWQQANYGDGTCVSTDGFLNGFVNLLLLRSGTEPQEMTAQLMPLGDGYAVRISEAQ